MIATLKAPYPILQIYLLSWLYLAECIWWNPNAHDRKPQKLTHDSKPTTWTPTPEAAMVANTSGDVDCDRRYSHRDNKLSCCFKSGWHLEAITTDTKPYLNPITKRGSFSTQSPASTSSPSAEASVTSSPDSNSVQQPIETLAKGKPKKEKK